MPVLFGKIVKPGVTGTPRSLVAYALRVDCNEAQTLESPGQLYSARRSMWRSVNAHSDGATDAQKPFVARLARRVLGFGKIIM